MADDQIDQNKAAAASDTTQVIEATTEHPVPDAANDQTTGDESKASSASQPRSAADSYQEVASKVFDSPQDTSGESNSDVNQQLPEGGTMENEEGHVQVVPTEKEVSQEAEPSVDKSSQGHYEGSKVEDVGVTNMNKPSQVKDEDGGTKNDTNGGLETAGDANDIHLDGVGELGGGDAKVVDFQEQTEGGPTANNDSNPDQNDTKPDQIATDQNSEVNNEQIIEQRTSDIAQIENGKELEISGERIINIDDTNKLSEDEIIQRLQDVNKELYKNDIDEGVTLENNELETAKENADDSDKNLDATKNTEIEPSGDGGTDIQTSANQIEGISYGGDAGLISAGVDADHAGTSELDQEIIAAGSEHQHAGMSEIMSEDLDALRVDQEAMYQDYARQEEAVENAAQEQEQLGKQHVKYADLSSQEEGALASSSQVSISKRSHFKGPSAPLPQTAPSRLSMSTVKSVHIPQIPSPPSSPRGRGDDKRGPGSRKSSQKLPPSLMRMSTVMVSARKRAVINRQASTYYEDRSAPKLVTLDQCINSRPPLPFDLDTPGPWHYSPRNKPLYETNAPEYSMGCKFYERDGGGRTAWSKSWFNSPDNFTRKVRWEKRWPSPNNYSSRSPILGRPQASTRSFPQFSIGVRTNFSINKRETETALQPGSENEPAPCQYNREKADHLVMRSAPSFSMAKRTTKTTLGKVIETTPSPSAYRPAYKHMSSHVHYPSFTIRGVRKDKIHALGPHATL